MTLICEAFLIIIKQFFLLLVLFILSAYTLTDARAQTVKEYAVKAAFVFNFARFTQWPESSFSDADTPYQLCFVGNDEVADEFKTIHGKKNGPRLIQVRQLEGDPARDCKMCHIIFISRDVNQKTADQILSKIKDRAVLVIGETKDFAKKGGVINFFSKENRLQFEINTRTAKDRGLSLSSRLLKLAFIVGGDE